MSDKMKTKEKGSPNTIEKKNAFIKKKSESTLAKEKKRILANVHRLNRLRSKENQAKRSSDYSRKNECDHEKHKRASSEKRAKENQGKKSSKTSRKQEKKHKRTMRKSKEHRDNENKKYLKRSYHVELLTLFFIH